MFLLPLRCGSLLRALSASGPESSEHFECRILFSVCFLTNRSVNWKEHKPRGRPNSDVARYSPAASVNCQLPGPSPACWRRERDITPAQRGACASARPQISNGNVFGRVHRGAFHAECEHADVPARERRSPPPFPWLSARQGLGAGVAERTERPGFLPLRTFR